MKRTKFEIEYQLKTTSINILWNSIGNPLGLAEWFADVVTVKENEFIFTWDKNDQIANLIDIKQNVSIRFQWEEDIDTEYYFELKIVNLDITGDLALIITDFAEPNDKDDLILLWDKQIETLRRKSGI